MKCIVPLLLAIAMLLSSCENDKWAPLPKIASNSSGTSTSTNCCCTTSVSYSLQVAPLLANRCVVCHDGSAGIKLNSYANVQPFASAGILSGCVSGDPNYTAMPPLHPLDSCSIKLITKWVQQGALNN